MPAPSSFDYAILRVVPRVERQEFLNAGVVVFCLQRDFLSARIALDVERLRAFAPDVDVATVEQHLASVVTLCEGGPQAGPLGALPRKERWHWLVAPRSTVVQVSPVHSGLCTEPEAALDRLVRTMVLATSP